MVVDGVTGLSTPPSFGSFVPVLGCVDEGAGDMVLSPVVESGAVGVESVAVPVGAVVVDWVGDVVVDCATAAPGMARAAAAIRPRVFISLSFKIFKNQ